MQGIRLDLEPQTPGAYSGSGRQARGRAVSNQAGGRRPPARTVSGGAGLVVEFPGRSMSNLGRSLLDARRNGGRALRGRPFWLVFQALEALLELDQALAQVPAHLGQALAEQQDADNQDDKDV